MEKEKIIDALRRAIDILKMLGYAGGDLDYFETVLEGAKNTEQQVQADICPFCGPDCKHEHD